MISEKPKSIGFGLRGQNIQMPTKINVKSLGTKNKKNT